MLYVFSINLVKLVTRKPKTTVILGRREYLLSTHFQIIVHFDFVLSQTSLALTMFLEKNILLPTSSNKLFIKTYCMKNLMKQI